MNALHVTKSFLLRASSVLAAALVVTAATPASARVESMQLRRLPFAAVPMQRAPYVRPAVDPVARYRASVEVRMRRARAAIAGTLARRRIPAAKYQQIMVDLDWSSQLIRQRVELYANDGRITAFETEQVESLATAIADDLRRLHGAIAPWDLLP